MPSLRFEIISALFELGTASPPAATVDPSRNELLRQGGVGLVTAHIEQLTLIDLLRDPMPLFGSDGGMWIGYRLTDQGRVAGRSEAALREAVGALIGGPRNEVSQAVAELEAECQQADINPNYRADFLRTLEEIRICFDNECLFATIALCGKVLEVCLKERLRRGGVEYDRTATIGQLLGRIRDRLPATYLDPSLNNIGTIINERRITAIHAVEQIPVPSRDQAIMVIFATRDVVRRTLVMPAV